MTPPGDIFRPEAKRFAERRLAGEVVFRSDRLLTIGVAVLLSVSAIILLVACTATYARKEAATGWLVTRSGVIRVQAQRAGVVRALPVAEGGAVEPGQVLAVVASTSVTTERDSRQIQGNEIDAEFIATGRIAEAALADLEAQQKARRQRRKALVSQLAEAQEQVSLLSERVEVEHGRLERNSPLAEKGYVSRSSLDQMKSSWIAAAQQTSAARASVVALGQQIADLDGELVRAPIERTNAQAEAASARAQIGQKRAAFDADGAETVRAPIAGRLLASPLSPGQSISAGATVAVVAPADSPLEAELYVPARAIGFVRAGQAVRLKYKAFPFQKFGVVQGVVRSISYTLLAPTEISAPLAELKEPTFRIRVALPGQSMNAYGARIPLQPGMLTDADIVLERRSLVQWLLDPLYAVRG